MERVRLDKLLVGRKYFSSREKAQEAILAGSVKVSGLRTLKVSSLVSKNVEVEIVENRENFVSRGGIKLSYALKKFDIDALEAVAIDIGTSTGGFCDCLLRNGAAKIYAIDVGYGQIAWSLRIDPRIVLMERCNARFLDIISVGGQPVDLITIDVSFISLNHILPVAKRLLKPDGHVVSLVKPQFEAGRTDVCKGGVVRSTSVHERVLCNLIDAAPTFHLVPLGLVESPILGSKGNKEFFIHWRTNQYDNLRLNKRFVAELFPEK